MATKNATKTKNAKTPAPKRTVQTSAVKKAVTNAKKAKATKTPAPKQTPAPKVAPKATKMTMEQKRQNLLNDVVKAYGDKDADKNGVVVTSKQVIEVHEKAPERYPHHVYITKTDAYKIRRGVFVVHTAGEETSAKLRDKILADHAKAETEKQARMLPKETRSSALKLAKALAENAPAAKKSRAKPVAEATAATDNSPVTQDDINGLGGDDDINALIS